MKTIATIDDWKPGQVVLLKDGQTIVSRHPDGVGVVFGDERPVPLTVIRHLFPATLIHPLVFTAEDVERAAEAIFDEETNTADSMDRPTWDQLWDGKDNGKGPYLTLACAVLGAVGSVEA